MSRFADMCDRSSRSNAVTCQLGEACATRLTVALDCCSTTLLLAEVSCMLTPAAARHLIQRVKWDV